MSRKIQIHTERTNKFFLKHYAIREYQLHAKLLQDFSRSNSHTHQEMLHSALEKQASIGRSTKPKKKINAGRCTKVQPGIIMYMQNYYSGHCNRNTNLKCLIQNPKSN